MPAGKIYRRPIDDLNLATTRVLSNQLCLRFHQELLLALGDIADDDVLLENCYVMDRYEIRHLRNILFDIANARSRRDLIGQLTPTISQPHRQRLLKTLGFSFETYEDDFSTLYNHFSSLAEPRTILLIGEIGSGKTTFLKKFIKDASSASTAFAPFYIDLNDEVVKSELETHGLERALEYRIDAIMTTQGYITELGSDVFAKIFEDDMTRDNYIVKYIDSLGDPAETKHLLAKLAQDYIKDHDLRILREIQYLCRIGKNPWIIIDNADHHSHAVQREAFTLASHKKSWYGCPVLLAIRNYNYRQVQQFAPISARLAWEFHLTPLKLENLLRSRFKYAVRIMKRRKISGAFPVQSATFGLKIRLSREMLLELFTKMTQCLQQREIREFLEKISNYNTRKQLEMSFDFMCSGHLSPWKFLPELFKEVQAVAGKQAGSSWSKGIPLHEFIRIVMTADNDYYDGEPNDVNVLDMYNNRTDGGPNNCLVRCRVLELVYQHQNGLSRDKVMRTLTKFLYEKESVHKALQVLLSRRLVESYEGIDLEQDPVIFIRRTLAGIYYHERLIVHPMYLYVVKDDVPTKNRLPLCDFSRPLEERFQAVTAFIREIEREEEEEIQSINDEELIAEHRAIFGPIGGRLWKELDNAVSRINRRRKGTFGEAFLEEIAEEVARNP